MVVKVLVAMSGGVDSSSVASKMLENGYEVEGATMKFGSFCSDLAVIDAKRVADQLNIKHTVLELGDVFENKVIKYFANEYQNGRTPNPCIKCNREIKFYELLKLMKELGADYLATGHYAKISNHDGEYYLEKGDDKTKDQSYFLSQLKYEYLQYIKFPLAEIEKIDVRKYAKKLNLVVAEKAESQDICFTAGKDYREILRNYCTSKNGYIMHVNGEKLGMHDGIINYTRGQRKGLGLGGYSEPLFVVDIDAEKNIVYVGSEKDLFKDTLKTNNVNFLDQNLKFDTEYEFDVKLRSTNNLDKAKVIFNNDLTANIKLEKSSRNIAKGQICCMYRGNRVVASGYII